MKFIKTFALLGLLVIAPVRANDKAVETLIDVTGIFIAATAAYYGIPKLVEYVRNYNAQLTELSKAPVTTNQIPTPHPDIRYVESDEWIQQNTKPCPNCGVRIEKNGGCNYMQCILCKCEFCWLCSKYHDHATHVCKK